MDAAAKLALRAVNSNKFARRTLLVTFESAGAVAHGEALAELHMGKPAIDLQSHLEHGVTRHWEAADIDSVVRARSAAHEAKRQTQGSQESAQQPVKKSKKRGP